MQRGRTSTSPSTHRGYRPKTGRCLKSMPRGPFHSSRRLRIHRWSLVPETLWTHPFTVTSKPRRRFRAWDRQRFADHMLFGPCEEQARGVEQALRFQVEAVSFAGAVRDGELWHLGVRTCAVLLMVDTKGCGPTAYEPPRLPLPEIHSVPCAVRAARDGHRSVSGGQPRGCSTGRRLLVLAPWNVVSGLHRRS